MSRSIHQSRKSARRAFEQGDIEPVKQYSLKSDLKRWTKNVRKLNAIVRKTLGASRATSLRAGIVESRNTIVLNALKKAKKPLNSRLDRKHGK